LHRPRDRPVNTQLPGIELKFPHAISSESDQNANSVGNIHLIAGRWRGGGPPTLPVASSSGIPFAAPGGESEICSLASHKRFGLVKARAARTRRFRARQQPPGAPTWIPPIIGGIGRVEKTASGTVDVGLFLRRHGIALTAGIFAQQPLGNGYCTWQRLFCSALPAASPRVFICTAAQASASTNTRPERHYGEFRVKKPPGALPLHSCSRVQRRLASRALARFPRFSSQEIVRLPG